MSRIDTLTRSQLIVRLENEADRKNGQKFQLETRWARPDEDQVAYIYLCGTGYNWRGRMGYRIVDQDLIAELKEQWAETEGTYSKSYRQYGAIRVLEMITGKEGKVLRRESKARTQVAEAARLERTKMNEIKKIREAAAKLESLLDDNKKLLNICEGAMGDHNERLQDLIISICASNMTEQQMNEMNENA